jgi:hypothetical protein
MGKTKDGQERIMMMVRTIIHLDLDAFSAPSRSSATQSCAVSPSRWVGDQKAEAWLRRPPIWRGGSG